LHRTTEFAGCYGIRRKMVNLGMKPRFWRICNKKGSDARLIVGGVSDADFATQHISLPAARRNHGQTPLLQEDPDIIHSATKVAMFSAEDSRPAEWRFYFSGDIVISYFSGAFSRVGP
jgi:hypothetical protein